MRILNTTPFVFAPIVGRVRFPHASLTLIVKGSFDLLPGGTAKLSDEPLFPTGDEYYPDDEEMQGSCRYESDFAFFKPRADLLLAGKCHTPDGRPVPRCEVVFRVGQKAKTLEILGNRHWKNGQVRPTDPEPFTEMELRYENSFGGEGSKKNPVGKGSVPATATVVENVRPLPSIEDPGAFLDSPRGQPDPVGFGPLGKMWEARSAKLGTYDDKWRKERWPWFPESFDYGFFNAAPPDMQVEGYLKGDEELHFENLHPEHSQYRSRLPGLRARCFLNELSGPGPGQHRFREVPMNLDTLWVDMEAEKLILVWRGVADVRSEELEEVQHVVIRSETLDQPSAAVQTCEEEFKTRLAAAEAAFQTEEPPRAESPETPVESVDAEQVKAEAELRQALLAAGIDPDAPPPQPTPEQKAEEARLQKEWGLEEPPEEPPPTRERFRERLQRGERFAGEDLTGLDLSHLDMKEVDFQGAILAGTLLKKANLARANLTGANLARADLSGANLQGARLKEADLTEAKLAEAQFTGAALEEAVLEKAVLEKAVLDQVSAKDATFTGANLSDASLRNAAFSGASFSQCNLDRADFRNADLTGARLHGAAGVQINMAHATLTKLKASGRCDFPQGRFQNVVGSESIWEEAQLKEADFSAADLPGADFTSASLERANVSGANLKHARFIKADLRDARLSRTNLFEVTFENADLTRADLRASNLYGAEVLGARLEEARLDSANLKMTKLARA